MTVVGRVRASVRTSVLSNRNFRLLCAGQLASTVGDYCYAVALPWLVLSARGGPVLLGRVMSLVMLASMGTFPVSVAVSGVLVRGLGPVAFFPVAGLVLALAILGSLSQRELREFGMAGRPG